MSEMSKGTDMLNASDILLKGSSVDEILHKGQQSIVNSLCF